MKIKLLAISFFTVAMTLAILFLLFPPEMKEAKIIDLPKREIVLEEKESSAPENNQEEKNDSVKILFLGDVMLDRSQRIFMDKNGSNWLTEKINRLFLSNDINLVNLEGPITNKKSVSAPDGRVNLNSMIFTFDPKKATDFLQSNKINLVNLGNNHILNFGQEGVEQTKNILRENEVEFFGQPSEENNFLIKEVNDFKVAFVNYNQFETGSYERALKNIPIVKTQADFCVVYTHWGEEYQLQENAKQKEKAHKFIDAGADLIVGTHPHVVQPIEIYKNKAIFYSLGNFVFDQFFSEDTKTGLAVNLVLSKNSQEFVLTPIYNIKGQIVLADENKKKILLERLAKDSAVGEEVKKEIIGGSFYLK